MSQGESDIGDSQLTGPFMYENWAEFNEGRQRLGGGELPMFTDAHITGQLESNLGPYQILNTISYDWDRPSHAPAMVLRYWNYVPDSRPEMEKTDTSRYHGGSLGDEVAALISLPAGIRVKAGGPNRQFGDSIDDPLGHPYYLHANQDPTLPHVGRRPMIPRCLGTHNLNGECGPLATIPRLSVGAANSLIRASRLYQEAVWIADVDPNMAWILLVSAVETVAGHWRRSKGSDLDRLGASRPKLVALLRERGDDNWVSAIASELAPYMGATKAFVDFLLEFLPEPPSDRSKGLKHSWEQKDLRDSFRSVYVWRSKALHGGTPFPLPMCDAPSVIAGDINERPMGFATAARGGVWVLDDTPMLLHLFEHIVRGAILKWWQSTLPPI